MAELPESTVSYWVDSTASPQVARPDRLGEVDVAVLGAGIAGLTAAYLLAGTGRSVTVIEAGRVAEGVSGYTTAKITSQHGLIYDDLRQRFGQTRARLYADSQQAALEWIAAHVEKLGIACDFSRRDSYVYAEDPSYRERLQREAEAAAELGLPAGFVEDVDLPFPVAGAVRFTGQAQFHPRRWLLALAQRVVDAGGRIVQGTRVVGIDEEDPPVVRTIAGSIRARDVVVATHYPIFDRGGFFARLEPKRDVVVAAPTSPDDVPQGMYIAADTGHSVRTTPYADHQVLLIIGGEGYRTGERTDIQARYRRLADWAHLRFGLQRFAYRWSAQDNITVDRIPYIGRYHPRARQLWVAAGFGLWGMTNGTLAGILLCDLLTGAANPWAGLYDPNRLNLRQSATGLVKANLKVGAHFLGDRARALTATSPADLKPGQATVSRVGGRMVAAYRDPTGRLAAVGARCTHLGCLVAFNDAEKTWDCPCHGSRFAPDGTVLHGPAVNPLQPINPAQDDG